MSSSKKDPKKTAVLPKAPAVVVAQPDLDDTIARNRRVAFTPSTAIAPVPLGYRPTRFEVLRRRLKRVPGSLRAEMLEALKELFERTSRIKEDLGDFAPDTNQIGVLIERVKGLDSSIFIQEEALKAHRELEDIALSDGYNVLERAYKHYEIRIADAPSLERSYAKLNKFFTIKNQAIATGIKRAKAKRQRLEKARLAAARSAEAKALSASEEATPRANNAASEVTREGTKAKGRWQKNSR
jgi:hypothetical protein